MEIADTIARAVEYVEENLAGNISAEEAARRAYCSVYHFERIFGVECGVTFGQYVRERRLTLAGEELKKGGKVLDVSLKYGYDSPEGFSRAFRKFHGVLPSRARDGALNSRAKFVPEPLPGSGTPDFTVEERKELVLVGYGKRFTGVPFGRERLRQEDEFFRTTRAAQWLLIGASCDPSTDYAVVSDADEEGYSFSVAYELDSWARKAIFDPAVTGADLAAELGLGTIELPKQLCAVFRTRICADPIPHYSRLREQIGALVGSGGRLADAPELVAYRWRRGERGQWRENRNIELYLPIEPD